MAKKKKTQKEFLDELITDRRGWNDALAAVLHTCSVVSGQKESEA